MKYFEYKLFTLYILQEHFTQFVQIGTEEQV